MMGNGHGYPPYMMAPYGSAHAVPPHAHAHAHAHAYAAAFYNPNPNAMNTMVPAAAQPYLMPSSQPPMWHGGDHHSQPVAQPLKSDNGDSILKRADEEGDIKNNPLKREYQESSDSSDGSSDEE